MENSERGYRFGSVRLRFLCMISHRDSSGSADKMNREFEHSAFKKPTSAIDTPQYAVRLWSSDMRNVFSDEQRGRLFLLYGEIYNSVSDNQLEWLAHEYDRKGLEFARDLNGSFVILLVDAHENRVAVITDRVNSRRAFYSRYAGSHWVSNCLYSHPLTNVDLDPVGVAWYLVNKSVFNNRTLFEGVKILERASIHQMKPEGFNQRQYWFLEFDNSYAGLKKSHIEAEFSRILVKSVQSRIQDKSSVYLALSGGYDSSAILGLLRYKLQIGGVKCFTFIHSRTPSMRGDAYIAGKMADAAGYEHKVLQGYGSDILRWIDLNGSIGNGTASLCGEIDALIKLFGGLDQGDRSVLFVGDQSFGCINRNPQSHRDVLDELTMRSVRVVPSLTEILGEDIYRKMRDGLEEDQKSIVAKYPRLKNLHDLKDVLYLDRELSNYLLPYKEYIYGDFITVVNPFLDNDILDFVANRPD